MTERKYIRGFLVLFALVQAWACRFYVDPDGVNYLDAARAYVNHDWALAFNGWWSPLYSWLLALALFVFRPTPQMESTVLHAVNFVIFVGALWSFEFFVREAVGEAPNTSSGMPVGEMSGLSTRLLWLLGYALFGFSTLFLISVRLDTPDLCVACLVFLAAGLVLRIRSRPEQFGAYVELAVVLAVSYYAKSVMFPLGFVFFFAAAGGKPVSSKRLINVLASVCLFLALTAPFVRLLSIRAGRLTFGDIGRMSYAMYVDGVPDPVRWQVGVPGTGYPVHQMTTSNTSPVVYSCARPFPTTYPPWYDGSYWYAGMSPHFTWRGQLRVLQQNLGVYYLIFSTRREFIVGFLAVALFCGSFRVVSSGILEKWPVWIPAVVPFVLYMFVHVESRFVGAFFTLLWMALFLGLRQGCQGLPSRFANGIIFAITVMVAITCVTAAAGDVKQIVSANPNEEWQAAQALQNAGFSEGDRVGIIGHTNVADYWAHLAGLSISAEIAQEDAPIFWQAPTDEKSRIVDEFYNTGARAIVTRLAPPPNAAGWTRLGQSPYYALFLTKQESARSAPATQTTSAR